MRLAVLFVVAVCEVAVAAVPAGWPDGFVVDVDVPSSGLVRNNCLLVWDDAESAYISEMFGNQLRLSGATLSALDGVIFGDCFGTIDLSARVAGREMILDGSTIALVTFKDALGFEHASIPLACSMFGSGMSMGFGFMLLATIFRELLPMLRQLHIWA